MPSIKILMQCNLCQSIMRKQNIKKHKCDDMNKPIFKKISRQEAQEIESKKEQNCGYNQCECGYKCQDDKKFKEHACRKETCYICLEELTNKTIIKSQCGHYQCEECFQSWQLETDSRCPVCRQILTSYTKYTKNQKIETIELKGKKIKQRIQPYYLQVEDAIIQ